MLDKRRKRELNRILKNKKFIDIPENPNFLAFFNKLDDYFKTHNMMGLGVSITDEKHYYVFNNTAKRCYAIKIYDSKFCNITLLPHKEGIELYRLEMYQIGQGLGTKFMNIFNQISKETGIKIFLIPGDPGFNQVGDPVKRRNFYHKHNFKRNANSLYWSN